MLSVSNIHVNYGKSRVVSNVSFTVANGQKLVLLGRNGVGKTTLLKCLMGLLPVEGNGRISIDGRDITKMPAYIHNTMGIGYVPQGREIIPELTVKDNLELGCLGHPAVNFRERLELILEYFPLLKEHLPRKGGVLSGGQQQQLAIARCLMGKPSILLLDEPTEGIQPNIVAELAAILNRISGEMDVSIVMVEQNLKFARRLANSFMIMQKGQIMATGEIGELTDALAQQYLAV